MKSFKRIFSDIWLLLLGAVIGAAGYLFFGRDHRWFISWVISGLICCSIRLCVKGDE